MMILTLRCGRVAQRTVYQSGLKRRTHDLVTDVAVFQSLTHSVQNAQVNVEIGHVKDSGKDDQSGCPGHQVLERVTLR